MKSELVLYEVAGRVATITLNRPEVLNAIISPMWQELNECKEAAEVELINRAVAPDCLEEEAEKLANQLAQNSVSQLAAMKADRQSGLRKHGASHNTGTRIGARRLYAQHARGPCFRGKGRH